MAATTGAQPMPPGGPIEIVFSFDTTGSMGSYIHKVRTEVTEIITRLLADIPFLRIAVYAHGDYCDASTYITKHVDFTCAVKELCDFVQKVSTTGGGDWEECYELVLQKVRTELSWQPGTQRALVMIGDAVPHDVDYYKNTLPKMAKGKGKGKKTAEIIDWKEEIRKLHEERGVRVYAVQCGRDQNANYFWEHLAIATDGKHLKLDNFLSIIELIMAICYRESGPDVYAAYEREIRDREGANIRKDMDIMFKHLRDPTTPTTTALPRSLSASGTPSLTKADSTSSSISTRSRKRPRSPSPDLLESDYNSESDSDFIPTASRSSSSNSEVDGSDSDSDSVSAVTSSVPAKKRKVDATVKSGPEKRVSKKKEKIQKTTNSASLKGRGGAIPVEEFIYNYNTAKQYRETKSAAFAFTDLNWTRWRLAMAPASAVTSARGQWRRRAKGYMGMRNTALFVEGRADPAVYEIAVKLAKSPTKHVVLMRTSGGFESQCWDTYLLRDLKVKRKIDTILAQGHKLYVRRAQLSLPSVMSVAGKRVKIEVMEELSRLMRAIYDYSWTERRLKDDFRGSRPVRRSGVLISGTAKSS